MNTGKVEGATVPQLYVAYARRVPHTPPKQLRGFDKVLLAPDKSRTVKFELMRRDLSYWDVVSHEWLIPKGEFVISVGFSSRDLKKVISIKPVAP